MNLSTKQKETHRNREQTCGCQGEEGQERKGLGDWDQQMKTIIYRMDKQVLLNSTGNSTQYLVITYQGK